MKLLTKEQEAAAYSATLRGGTIGGFGGLALGAAGVFAASRRYHFFRSLTLPLKAFLVTSSGTFFAIIGADHTSRQFQTSQNPIDQDFEQRQSSRRTAEVAGMTFTERAMDFGKKERYKIVGASWIASMATAFALVNRNKYLTGPQKLVQARVYAQFLTLGVLVASAAFEINDSKNDEGRWETVKIIDPKDPEHKRLISKRIHKEEWGGEDMWKDMVDAEEERLKQRDETEKNIQKEQQAKTEKKNGGKKVIKDQKN